MPSHIHLKTGRNGVHLAGMVPQIVLALAVASPIWAKHAQGIRISSVNDGRRKKGSLHPLGCAIDFSFRDVPLALHKTLTAELDEALGDEYDVIYEIDTIMVEGQEVKVYHVHIEWQPSRSVR